MTIKKHLILSIAIFITACAPIPGSQSVEQNSYTLNALPEIASSTAKSNDTLLVTVPRAHAGYNTPQMAYIDKRHSLAYFATHRWADKPSQMIASLLVQAVERSNHFKAAH